MAQANQRPTADAQAGAAAFDEDLPRVLDLLGAPSIESLGWSKPNRLTLLVPTSGVHNGTKDDFLLRLGFQAYRAWPPSAQFVNPATLTYVMQRDQRFVPRLASPECHTHLAYQKPGGGTVQLICCSATLEFYDVLHSVQPEHVWKGTETFLTTITAIERAMTSCYTGRF